MNQREVEMTVQAYMTQMTVSNYTPVMAVAWPQAAARVTRTARSAVAPGCEVTEPGVRDVLEAAGALAVQDIAGALCSTVREVQEVVWRMLDRGGLRADEWGRVGVGGQ
jgi:hypothetical protein